MPLSPRLSRYLFKSLRVRAVELAMQLAEISELWEKGTHQRILRWLHSMSQTSAPLESKSISRC
jgi:hypothetical protein